MKFSQTSILYLVTAVPLARAQLEGRIAIGTRIAIAIAPAPLLPAAAQLTRVGRRGPGTCSVVSRHEVGPSLSAADYGRVPLAAALALRGAMVPRGDSGDARIGRGAALGRGES